MKMINLKVKNISFLKLNKLMVILPVILLMLQSFPAFVYAIDARSSSSGGDVFLGGDYIEVGISSAGSFGTASGAPAGFHTKGGRLGLQVDADGWETGNAPTTGDFFLPGSPEERFILAYKKGDTIYQNKSAQRMGVSWPSPSTISTTDNSNPSKGFLKATTTGTSPENVVYKQVVYFNKSDKFYTTKITITNNSGGDISELRYVRSFDPDMDKDINGTHYTYARVVSNPNPSSTESSQAAMVVARGSVTLDAFFFIAFDSRARASAYVAFNPEDAYMDGLWREDGQWYKNLSLSIPSTISESNYALTSSMVTSSSLNGFIEEDNGIALTFNLGNLAKGESTDFIYYSSMDPNVNSSLAEIEDVISTPIPEDPPVPEATPVETEPESPAEKSKIDPITLLKGTDGSIQTDDLAYLVAVPEQWMDSTAKVEFWLDAAEVKSGAEGYSYIESARDRLEASGDSLLSTFDIKLMQRITAKDGTVTEGIVSNEYIRGNVPVRLRIPENLQHVENLGIAYIDSSGLTATLESKIITIDGIKYIEFENNHFSVYGLVTGLSYRSISAESETKATVSEDYPKTGEYDFVYYLLATGLAGLIVVRFIHKRLDSKSNS